MIVKTYGKIKHKCLAIKIFKLDDEPLKSIRDQDLTLMSVVFTQCCRGLAGAGACSQRNGCLGVSPWHINRCERLVRACVRACVRRGVCKRVGTHFEGLPELFLLHQAFPIAFQ